MSQDLKKQQARWPYQHLEPLEIAQSLLFKEKKEEEKKNSKEKTRERREKKKIVK
jgi:hypothetical protein